MAGGGEDGAAVDDAERAVHAQAQPFEHGGEVPGVDRLAVDRGLAADGVEPGAVQKGRQQRMAGECLVEPGERRGGLRQGAGQRRIQVFSRCRPQQCLEHFFHPRRTGAASAGAALRRPAGLVPPIRVESTACASGYANRAIRCNSPVIRSDPPSLPFVCPIRPLVGHSNIGQSGAANATQPRPNPARSASMTATATAPRSRPAPRPAALADARPTPLPAPAPTRCRRRSARRRSRCAAGSTAPSPPHCRRSTARLATARATARRLRPAGQGRQHAARLPRRGRAWCAWCARHALPCLPASAADVVAFLAAERRRGLSVTTVELRRAAIRYLHYLAGCAVPTAEAVVGETLAGIRRDAAHRGEFPAKKLAATADVLREILAPIPDDLRGLRDRALLLVGFAGALRRSELAAIRVEHLEPPARGLRLTLPLSKGERDGNAVTVALPLGTTELCPVRALRRWQEAAGITEGALFRRIWLPPARGGIPRPPTVGTQAIDRRTVARIVQARAAAAGFDAATLGGHSLKRGALTTGMDHGVHPARLKQLGRHKSYAVLDEYLELGDPFESHPLSGLL